MSDRKPLVVGNWKSNGRTGRNAELLAALRGLGGAGCEVAVCPAFVHLPQALAALAGSAVAVGAQNLSLHDDGAYTGEVGAGMLQDLGCRFVIVGHSERRALFGEADTVVADKTARALQAGLVPIVCVGETLEEREAGRIEAVIGAQLEAVRPVLGDRAATDFVVAYEPVWAIGTGRSASPEQAQTVHRFIRERLGAAGQGVRLLYGGSVKAANAAQLFAMPDIDGALVGGAALVAADFTGIVQAAQAR